MLGRFLSPDSYVQAPDFTQSFNRYSYCMNNPLIYTDPSGEIFWFVPIIIGTVIGATSGAIMADQTGAQGFWEWAGYVGGGALIGGLSGGAAAGVSALGGGAMLAGAAAGVVGGAGFSGMATGWNGQAMSQGAAFGAISGFVGGGVGGAIGGGVGAFAGGAVGSGLNTALYGGSGEDILKSAIVGGALSYGTYELTSYIGWKGGGNRLGNHDISYKQYKTMQADFQRSRFWGKEYGGFLMNDGSVQRFPGAWRNSHGIQPPGGGGIAAPGDAFAMYHTHWDAPGKTIWVDAMGNRVDNSSEPLALLRPGVCQTTTARGHGAYDYIHLDSYVINRYEVTYNIGGTRGLVTYNDPFLRFFPWFNFW